MARDAHRVLLITTGGTIAGQVADTLQDAAMKRTAGEFSALIGEAVEYLNIKHSLDISIESQELINVDSSDIQPAVWTELAETVREKYDEHDSFIITHGTNTLGYTC